MARAKKTYRAEARRNARMTTTTTSSGTTSNQAGGGKATSGGAAAPGGPATPSGAPRPSVLGAFRDAWRPLDLRSDIRDIPWLVTKTHAIWLPSLLVVGAALWFASSGGTGNIQSFGFQLFVYPPPQIGALFLAGILTERMSYMAGGIVGLVCGIVFSIYLLVGPLPAGALDGASRQVFVFGALVLSPVSGFIIGGFAGFYRRFLRRANPNAGRRQPPAKGKGTKAPARR